mmetsp:Transcript_1844/g.5550  ORF Transcript_1844/g.5550 Transcript_1844/m.5550 type:complete len:217 (-) Transcript_1844:337-987(-)
MQQLTGDPGGDRRRRHAARGRRRRRRVFACRGDCLLLEVSTLFRDVHRNTNAFALLSEVPASRVCDVHGKAAAEGGPLQRAVANASLLLLLLLSATNLVPLLPLTLSLSALLVGAGCLSVEQAWNSIAFRVLITIAASFGLGAALDVTHVSALLAAGLTRLSASVPPVVFLAILFLCTSALSCIVSNSVPPPLRLEPLAHLRRCDSEPQPLAPAVD